jgi:hypothetical protein
LKADADKITGDCPLSGHAEVEKEYEEEESDQNARILGGDVILYDDSDWILRESFSIQVLFFVTATPFAPSH